MAAIAANGTVELFSEPGRIGKIQGNHVPATPTAIALQTIKIPAIRDNVKVLVNFSFLFIKNYS
jgi:hypothetical protein